MASRPIVGPTFQPLPQEAFENYPRSREVDSSNPLPSTIRASVKNSLVLGPAPCLSGSSQKTATDHHPTTK